jgi:glycosyltransferase involved in cell wall biosynthesis
MGLPEVALVVQRPRHHAGVSGYHQLADHLVAGGAATEVMHHFPRRGTWRLAQPFVRRSNLAWYGAEAFLTEIWSAAAAWRGGIVHFMYGENSYRYAAAMPAWHRRLVATFHLPPAIFGDFVGTTHHLERLDAIVLVASNQLPILDRLRCRPAAYVVPHGVDVGFYAPPPSVAARPTCLFVGQWLRDFVTLREVVRQVHRAMPQAIFRLVLPPTLAAEWTGQAGVEVLTELNDVALRLCYQEASLLVMPLRDCTANNAVLEAMACGVPIVATEVGGIRDYVDRECARLVPVGRPDVMAEAALDLLGDPVARAAMARAARTRAENFAWPRVSKDIQAVYEAVR